MSETTETVVMVETANNTAVAVEDPKSEKDFLNLIPRALNAEGMKEALLKKPVAVEPLQTDKIHSIMRDVNAVKKAKNTLAVSMFDVVKKAESTPRKEYSPIDQLKKDIKRNLTRAGAELGLLVEKKDKTASQIERMGVLENAVTLLKLLDSNFEGCLSTTVTNHVRL